MDCKSHLYLCHKMVLDKNLDQQLRALEKAFLTEGGLRERMIRARLDARRKKQRGES